MRLVQNVKNCDGKYFDLSNSVGSYTSHMEQEAGPIQYTNAQQMFRYIPTHL
jgi:hypothetical protein